MSRALLQNVRRCSRGGKRRRAERRGDKEEAPSADSPVRGLSLLAVFSKRRFSCELLENFQGGGRTVALSGGTPKLPKFLPGGGFKAELAGHHRWTFTAAAAASLAPSTMSTECPPRRAALVEIPAPQPKIAGELLEESRVFIVWWSCGASSSATRVPHVSF